VLREIIAFEWRYHARQPAFLAASLIFLLFGFAVGRSFGPSNIAVNSPYVVMESTGFISLLSVFAVAIFAANAALRDIEHRMDGIVFTTAVSKFNYLFGRFAGALLATLSVVAFSMIGMIAVRFGPWLDPARIAPFDLRPYLASFAVMTIPNVAFAAALLFALAVLTRNALATYAGAVVLYVLYLMSAALTSSPLMAASSPGAGGGAGAALLDPFGLSAFFEVTRFWTASAKSTAFIGTQPLLLANRAIWLGATATIWLFVLRTFSFRTRGAVPRDRRAQGLSQRRLAAGPAAGLLPASLPPETMPPTSRRPGRLQAGAPALHVCCVLASSRTRLLRARKFADMNERTCAERNTRSDGEHRLSERRHFAGRAAGL
jgi:ABC-type transport system involved in multi-copper enzyme maturation permease subunit